MYALQKLLEVKRLGLKSLFNGRVLGSLPSVAGLAPKPDSVESFRWKSQFTMMHLENIGVSIHIIFDQLLKMSGLEI